MRVPFGRCSLGWVLGALVAFGASADAQVLSAPFALNAPVIGPGDGNQQNAAVAWTGSEYAVIWQDLRNGRDADLFGARVSASGTQLVRENAALGPEPRNQTAPALALGPGSLLVTWLDDTVCASEVMARLYSTDLLPLGPAVRLSMGACTSDRPSVAWLPSASRWLVAWGNHGQGREVHGALVSAAGTVDVPDFPIAAAANSAATPWVTTVGTSFLVVFADDRGAVGAWRVYAATVSGAGVVTATQPVGGAVVQTRPCAARVGAGAGVAWDEGATIQAAFFDDALAAQTPMPVAVATGSVDAPACATDTFGNLQVAWEDLRSGGREIYVRAVSPTSTPPEALVLPRGSFARSSPRVASGPQSALVVAHGQTSYVAGDDTVARGIDFSGLLVDAGVLRVCSGASSAERVNAAFDGRSYLAVWRDNGRIAAGSEVTAQRVEPGTGAWLAPAPGLYITNGINNLGSYPWASGGDAGFFVSWGDEGSAGQVKGAPVSSSGVVGSRQLLSNVSNYANHHRTRWFGGSHLTVFLKSGAVRTRRSLQSGAALQTETLVATIGPAPEELSVAALDDLAMIAVLMRLDGGVDVGAVLLDLDGGTVGPLAVLSALPGDEAEPALAANGTEFFLAWTVDAGLGSREVLTSRITRTGQALDVPPLTLGVGRHPAVEWTGAHWLVAFQRDNDLYAQRLGAGLLADVMPLLVAGTPELERRPGLATGNGGEVLITWDAYQGDPSWNFRALGRFFVDLAAGPLDGGLVDGGAGVPDGGGGPADADRKSVV